MLLKKIAITLFYAVICMTWIMAVDSKKLEEHSMNAQTIDVPSCKFNDPRFTDNVTEDNA